MDWAIYFNDVPTAALFQYTRSLSNFSRMHFFNESFVAHALAGTLPPFTVVEPGFIDAPPILNASDMHPVHPIVAAETLVKTVYEALRASPDWNTTALVLTFDEHGGFYDGVPPPTGVPAPDDVPCADCGSIPFNFTRLGLRVPMVIVSPWVEAGAYVTTVPPGVAPTPTSQFELNSVLATVHNVLSTGSFLTARDAWAAPLDYLWETSPLPGPRTDCPTVLPTPVNVTRPGAVSGWQRPLSGLARDYVDLVHALTGVRAVEDLPAAHAAAGIVTEADGGLWALARMRELLQQAKAAAPVEVPVA